MLGHQPDMASPPHPAKNGNSRRVLLAALRDLAIRLPRLTPGAETSRSHLCRMIGDAMIVARQSMAAPSCDGWLKEKMGKYGRFLGCSNYPECSYTRNLQEKP